MQTKFVFLFSFSFVLFELLPRYLTSCFDCASGFRIKVQRDKNHTVRIELIVSFERDAYRFYIVELGCSHLIFKQLFPHKDISFDLFVI